MSRRPLPALADSALNERLIRLVDFLQDHTNLAEMIDGYGGNEEATENNPQGGDFAQIERWLRDELGGEECEELHDLALKL